MLKFRKNRTTRRITSRPSSSWAGSIPGARSRSAEPRASGDDAISSRDRDRDRRGVPVADGFRDRRRGRRADPVSSVLEFGVPPSFFDDGENAFAGDDDALSAPAGRGGPPRRRGNAPSRTSASTSAPAASRDAAGLDVVRSVHVPVPVNCVFVGFGNDEYLGLHLDHDDLARWFEHMDTDHAAYHASPDPRGARMTISDDASWTSRASRTSAPTHRRRGGIRVDETR